MTASRRELFWSVLLFLLSSGGISFANQSPPLLREKLQSIFSHCGDSSAKASGCLRAARSILDNSNPPKHFQLQHSKLLLEQGIQSDRAEVNLEQGLSKLDPQERSALFLHLPSEQWLKESEEAVLQEAINAALSAEDPHSHLAGESQNGLWGIGAFLIRHDDRLYVTELIETSSAARAGLQAGDQILSINGIPAEQLSNHARRRLFKWATMNSDQIQLEVKRGKTRFTLSMNAERNSFANVESSEMGDILLLRLRSLFREGSCDAISHELQKQRNRSIRGIVLDLRNNPGGLVREAICVGGLFMGPQILMAKFESLDSSQKNFELLTRDKQITTLPMLVLVNENTASSAEIVAAAFQDQKRAKVVGVRTFGKGTMQSLIQENLPLYRSTHRILRASGAPLQELGVEPNFPLKSTHKALRELDLYGNVLAKYGPLQATQQKRQEKIADPCSKSALQESPEAASASLLHCTL